VVDLELRRARIEAHDVFDQLWRGDNPPMRRSEAYLWLSQLLGLSRDETHMSQFSISQCKTVIAAVEKWEEFEAMNPRVNWTMVGRRRRAKKGRLKQRRTSKAASKRQLSL
jgi:hypothetical protein